MTRNEFISELEKHLAGLPEIEITRAREYYVEYFNEAYELGKTDEQITAELDPPEVIAARIRVDLGAGTVKSKSFRDTVKEHWVIFLIIGIAACPIIIPVLAGGVAGVFGLLAGLFGLIVGIIAALGALVVSGFAIMVAAISLFVVGITCMFTAQLFKGFIMIGTGFILLGLSCLIVIGSIALIRLTVQLVKKFVLWTGSKLRKEKSA